MDIPLSTEQSTLILTAFLFEVFQSNVKGDLAPSPSDKEFTYGISRISALDDSIKAVVTTLKPKETGFCLNSLESLLLRFCAWEHDLGMIRSIAEKYWADLPKSKKNEELKKEILLKNAAEISADYILKGLGELLERRTAELRGVDGDKLQTEYVAVLCAAESPKLETEDVEQFFKNLRTQPGFRSRLRSDVDKLAATVNLIAQHHRRSESIDECPEHRQLAGVPIRPRLLSAVCRLANAINLDHARFTQKASEVFSVPLLREADRRLWIKSFIVSSIQLVPDQNAVHIQADLPLDAGKTLGRRDEVLARLQEMLSFIVADLEEDVLSVSKVLHQNRFPLLLGVTSEIQEIPAMKYTDDIRAALDSIYAAASPNTSVLMTITIGGLRASLTEIEKRRELDDIDQIVSRVLADILAQQDQRPCHEGLRKIGELLELIYLLWAKGEAPKPDPPEKDPSEKKVPLNPEGNAALLNLAKATQEHDISRWRLRWTLVEGVCEVFRQQREKVQEACRNADFLKPRFENCSHIVLYGFSQQVLDLLAGYYKEMPDRVPHIHVLECRTKTKHASSGRLLYLDGQRYAKALRERLRAPVITLEPDVALGRILLEPEAYDGNKPAQGGAGQGQTVVLLGSNAVYPDGTFVHSMGHTAVAATAKALGSKTNCKVVVVTDGMKIGQTPEKREEQERNPDVWLTHNRDIVNDLKNRKIELHNWREDRVPPKLIDALVVLDLRCLLHRDDSGDKPFASLSGMEFDARKAYADALPQRILASIAARSAKRPAKSLARRYPERSEMDQDWDAAGDFLTGGLAGEDLQKLEWTAAGQSVNEWLSGLWTQNLSEAVENLASLIKKPEPST